MRHFIFSIGMFCLSCSGALSASEEGYGPDTGSFMRQRMRGTTPTVPDDEAGAASCLSTEAEEWPHFMWGPDRVHALVGDMQGEAPAAPPPARPPSPMEEVRLGDGRASFHAAVVAGLARQSPPRFRQAVGPWVAMLEEAASHSAHALSAALESMALAEADDGKYCRRRHRTVPPVGQLTGGPLRTRPLSLRSSEQPSGTHRRRLGGISSPRDEGGQGGSSHAMKTRGRSHTRTKAVRSVASREKAAYPSS